MDKTIHADAPCATEPVPSPMQLAEAVPLGAEGVLRVADARRQVRRVLDGSDPRLLVVVGPCSAHDPDAVVEYGRRLRALVRAEVDDALCVVMRAYVEKPRTTVGWKGLASDPDLDGSCRLADGLDTSRRLLRDLVVDVDQPVAVEFLSPLVAPYLADLVTWGAVGARTTESQVHREMASALPLPIGFKNSTDGSVATALDAVRTAAQPHTFLWVDGQGRIAAHHGVGNPSGHIVLRGSPGRPNFDASSVASAVAAAAARRMDPLPAIVIDCSHDNSGKDHRRQADVVRDVAGQIRAGCAHIKGVMIESFLTEGRQNLPMVDTATGDDTAVGRDNVLASLQPGVSVTDACLGWDDTVVLLCELASAVRDGRRPLLRV
ncbi:phospho-2-dehydro-3-deoxyheptonate aldolase [Pandoravirus inopinatum]|uniref:3-deoxy-7-phosphoheptulonate synthase n=1 Tax=Pandoravirus inopinatum TaxID=1605721 RepID=A0A0B5IW14_9VIRU|nr:phospho-2-dehydro-3-deoxyheptonate aldolase [Pandoravirus inopinatum]AJF96858.1 phospho-2-dehydro-3-deoxyheptonate aldolase [Pandoravirus inopinatum]